MVFRNNSAKDIFGEIMSDSKKLNCPEILDGYRKSLLRVNVRKNQRELNLRKYEFMSLFS